MTSMLSHYWLWGGFMAPTLGAITAIGVYDLFLRRKDPIVRLELQQITSLTPETNLLR